MIKLTKLNKQTFYLNAIYIERVDSTPDTVITLINGRKIIVLESAGEVTQLVTEYYRQAGMIRQIIKEGLPSSSLHEDDAQN
ncbi:flagellar protein FlbD [Caldalkalibacillus uzonensis]|uniref:Flagellar protein FlbD n=1 Tax=Caldalkalibacillus uzonensis TaxID=353224 RepID=A0ABU0CLH8_9BACI|nr:flagellar FlbD family protein [Caldalkalibacillus uzonensis]MDQ0337271.1 flagellar protein FlbD [Caldalkalibacillus uzonensis]